MSASLVGSEMCIRDRALHRGSMESREAAVQPPDAALPHDEDAARLRGAFEAVCNNNGGPQQFLKARLGSKEAQIKFAKQL
eukprot:994872-Alexandrium_andersonii.AAC.1